MNRTWMGLLLTGVFAFSANAATIWGNRADVVKSAERLETEVEPFDESLHALSAPVTLIAKVHHFEETVMEFAEGVKTWPFEEANREMEHLREDVQLVRSALWQESAIANHPRVQTTWQRLRVAYRFLDHSFIYIPGTGPDPITTLTLNGAEYLYVNKGDLVSTPANVRGSGSIAFKDPLPEEDNNYTLGFNLEDGGALTLIANSDAELKTGVNLTFARQGKALKVILKAGGKTDDLSPEFSTVAADVPLSISIDVHGHGHVVVWVGAGEKQEYAFTGDAHSLRWGVALSKASLTQAKRDEEKDGDGEEPDHHH